MPRSNASYANYEMTDQYLKFYRDAAARLKKQTPDIDKAKLNALADQLAETFVKRLQTTKLKRKAGTATNKSDAARLKITMLGRNIAGDELMLTSKQARRVAILAKHFITRALYNAAYKVANKLNKNKPYDKLLRKAEKASAKIDADFVKLKRFAAAKKAISSLKGNDKKALISARNNWNAFLLKGVADGSIDAKYARKKLKHATPSHTMKKSVVHLLATEEARRRMGEKGIKPQDSRRHSAPLAATASANAGERRASAPPVLPSQLKPAQVVSKEQIKSNKAFLVNFASAIPLEYLQSVVNKGDPSQLKLIKTEASELLEKIKGSFAKHVKQDPKMPKKEAFKLAITDNAPLRSDGHMENKASMAYFFAVSAAKRSLLKTGLAKFLTSSRPSAKKLINKPTPETNTKVDATGLWKELANRGRQVIDTESKEGVKALKKEWRQELKKQQAKQQSYKSR